MEWMAVLAAVFLGMGIRERLEQEPPIKVMAEALLTMPKSLLAVAAGLVRQGRLVKPLLVETEAQALRPRLQAHR
jgi:hypothetical protein